MDPGPEQHPGPRQQDVEDMEDGHHSESEMSTQGSEYVHETDSGTDLDEELHCGAEPHWVDVAAAMGPCSLECPAHIMPADFRVMTEAGHVDLTYGLNPRVRLEKRYRRCVCERMVKGIMTRCDNS